MALDPESFKSKKSKGLRKEFKNFLIKEGKGRKIKNKYQKLTTDSERAIFFKDLISKFKDQNNYSAQDIINAYGGEETFSPLFLEINFEITTKKGVKYENSPYKDLYKALNTQIKNFISQHQITGDKNIDYFK